MAKSRSLVDINNKDECSILMIQNFDVEEICHKFQCIFILENDHLQEVCDNIHVHIIYRETAREKNNFTDITSK